MNLTAYVVQQPPPTLSSIENANWAIIQTQLVANNAVDEGGFGYAYKFKSWDDLETARENMIATIPWAFFVGPHLSPDRGSSVCYFSRTVESCILTHISLKNVTLNQMDRNFFELGITGQTRFRTLHA